MSRNERPFTLGGFKSGALEARFQYVLQQLLANVADPNVPRKGKRKIVIELSFTASEDRAFAAVEARVDAKLPGTAALGSFALFRADEDGLVAVEPVEPDPDDDPRQSRFAVVPFKQATNEKEE